MITTKIDCTRIEQHETCFNSSFYINDKYLSSICPIKDAQCFKAILNDDDFQRVFLCAAPNLIGLTHLKDCLLKGLTDEARTVGEVPSLLKDNIDLRITDRYAPVFISPNINSGPFVAIDGNHRLMAHFLRHQSIEGIHAYLFVHPGTTQWPWFPEALRNIDLTLVNSKNGTPREDASGK